MPENKENDKLGNRLSHDAVYKFLLKIKWIVLAFLRCAAKNSVLASNVPEYHVEFPNGFETRSGKQVFSGIVWAAKRGDSDCLLYIDLEIQAENDFFMPARLFQYIGSIYTKLVQTGQHKIKQLSPVIAVVIYNGERPCTAPISLEELEQDIPEELHRYLPKFEYILIDIQREVIRTDLFNEPAPLIVQQDQVKTQEQAIFGIYAILNLPDHIGSSEAFQLFLRYMPAEQTQKSWGEIQPLNLEEIFNMGRIEGLTWREYDELQAMAKGESKGRAEGRLTDAFNTVGYNRRTVMITTGKPLEYVTDFLHISAEKPPQIISAISLS